MATDKTFTIAGVSTQHGKTKQRFANGSLVNRVKVLERNEHTDIKLYDLPNPMTKDEARAWLEQKFGAMVVPASIVEAQAA
jgi:hypothetical protein